MTWRESAHEVHLQIADTVAQTLRSRGLSEPEANSLAYHIMRDLVRVFGGMQTYIPMATCIDVYEKREAIAREFNGRNTRELAKKYGVSVVHVYRILKQQRSRQRGKRD